MKKLEFCFTGDKDALNKDKESIKSISNIISPSSPNSSCWWKNMKSNLHGFGNFTDYISQIHGKRISGQSTEDVQPVEKYRTIKTCPAILDILKNSFLIKAPGDCVITITKNNEFIYDCANDWMQVSSHPQKQFYSDKENIFDGKMNIKFKFPLAVRTDGMPLVWLQPMYHTRSWYTVANGVISHTHTKGNDLNINVLVDLPETDEPVTYKIKHGEVLAYLWSPQKLKLSHSKKNFVSGFHIKRFVGIGSSIHD